MDILKQYMGWKGKKTGMTSVMPVYDGMKSGQPVRAC